MHNLERVADAYAAALEETAGRDGVRAEVLTEVAQAAQEIGLEPTSPELERVGDALSEVGFGD